MSKHSFRAKSHILSLLGDELIGSDILAIFELVKNSYDAGANEVKIILNNLNTDKQEIIVEDDGCGMTPHELQNIWLEIGTDYKRGEKRKTRFNRIPLGEKGVGRLAVHKLGRCILLETQTVGSLFISKIFLDWPKLISESDYIEDTIVEIEMEPTGSLKKGKGTRITISELKKNKWSKKDLRELARKVNTIKSPFVSIDDFQVTIQANDHHQEWFEDVKDVNEILDSSIYQFNFSISPQIDLALPVKFSWNYTFKTPRGFKIECESKSQLEEDSNSIFYINPKDNPFQINRHHLIGTDFNGIGAVSGRFYVYNLLPIILKTFGQTKAIKDYVRDNCGVKIFRDGIRVYNYGEPNDDWLGLDLARVQKLGNHFSKNTVIGAVDIVLRESQSGLKEKTNREGFDENEYFIKFKYVCQQVFDYFEKVAQSKRNELKDVLSGINPVKKIGLSETLIQLEDKIKEKNLEREFSPYIKRIERDYNSMRDVMLNSGMSGLNLGIVFHEVDREIKYIDKDLENNIDHNIIKDKIRNLISLLENFSPLLKQNKNISITAKLLIERVKNINSPRFKHHDIIISVPLLTNENEDFAIKGPGNLLVSSLSNIIDNAIYWVSARKDIEGESCKPAIYIGTDLDNFSGPAIIIADNGYGFNLDPEELIQPFKTTKPGGMGLGLYFTNMVFEMIGGKIEFPDIEELNIPSVYNGAIIALVFPKD